ncbi:MAG: hypothetical protein JKY95_08555 [Planctomycetaceae bacterium]|nr:hypothetical protein [Planctomycetaceae bacterium]
MAAISIPCPKCQSKLKLKDRSLLGKTGKCPKCQHKFVLQEQTEVQLELVEPTNEPAEGVRPVWLPDEAPAQTSNEMSFLEQTPAPEASSQTPSEAPADNPLSFLQEQEPSNSPVDSLQFGSTSETATSAYKKKKRRGSNKTTLGITFLILFLAIGGVGYMYQQGTIKITKTNKTASSKVAKQGKGAGAATSKSSKSLGKYNPVLEKSPTSGKPIQLLNMPAGVRIVINLHPAKFWGSERQYAEFRASLGPLGSWLETQIKDLSKHQELAEIEEMLIGIILGPRGAEPEIAAVIHFAQEQKRSQLLSTYDGEPHSEFNTDLKIADGRAYRIVDSKTVAICPEEYVEDLITFEKTPALTGDNIQEILKATDRQRLVTVVFDPADIDQHLEVLLPLGAKMVTEKALRWLGEDVWAAAWSVHVDQDFYTELIVRGQNEVGPTMLSRRYRERLDTLPEMLLTSVQKMEPQRAGYREIIGRYPAMMKVVAMTAAVAVDGRYVRMGTLLPLKAGPNLALGTLLAWDESTRTDFSTKVVSTKPKVKKIDIASLPMKQRLERKIDVDFRGTPLQEAFAYIAEEAKIKIEVDGDALKLAGFTKNMRQTFKMDQTTVREAIYGIIKTYEDESVPMVIHVSEKENKIIVLVKPVAETRKLEIYQFKTKK